MHCTGGTQQTILSALPPLVTPSSNSVQKRQASLQKTANPSKFLPHTRHDKVTLSRVFLATTFVTQFNTYVSIYSLYRPILPVSLPRPSCLHQCDIVTVHVHVKIVSYIVPLLPVSTLVTPSCSSLVTKSFRSTYQHYRDTGHSERNHTITGALNRN
jgi:hypothetical protein